MEALFDAPSNSHGCASLADLQQQLSQLLDSKATPTKAEHVSVTFELRSNVTFAVPVTDAENVSLEAGGGVDPRLFGGVARAGSTVTGVDGRLIRHINAPDTVLNQSQDDPVIQRTVAKYVMAGVGEADQSQWIMRSMKRENQGWTFTYGCKDSAQTWARQNAKNPPKTIIGEWTKQEGQDPVNLSRPAFDCRGTLTIAFSKSEKAISVKYEHTNMHKTVAELLDLLAPPPPRPQPLAIEGRKSISKKTPKKRQAAGAPEDGVDTPGEEGATPRPKKRKKPTQEGQDGEPSTQKKRSRKKKSDADAQIDLALSMPPPEMPGARPVGESSQRPLYNPQAQQDGAANGGAYPQGLVGNEPFNGSEAQASAMVSSGVHAGSILDLPAGEAGRRREVAIRILAEAKVDPQTLSPEHFSIFANQSPALQQESLKMLVEYGAERLRIVLPGKPQDAAENTAPPSQQQSAVQVPVVDVPQQDNPVDTAEKRKRRVSRKKAEADGTGVADEPATLTRADAAGNRQKKPRAPKLSRGACTPCRALKTKCGKEKPSCEQCAETGTDCSYPLQQSRKSKAAEDEVEDALETVEAEQPADTPEAIQNEDEEPDDLPSPGFSYQDPGAPPHHDSVNQDHEVEDGSEHGPMQDNAQSTYEEPSNGLYHHSSGLTFPDSISPEVTQQMWTTGAGTGYSQHGSTTNNGLGPPLQIQESSNTLSFPDQRNTASASASHTEAHQHQKSWGSYTSSQRSGAVDIPTTTSSVSANVGLTTTSWPAPGYSTSEAASTKRASASPRQSRRTAKPSNASTYTSSIPDGMPPVSALAQAAINSAAARTASPVQNSQYDPASIVRAKSRQGMKPQTQQRNPLPSQPSRQAQRSTSVVAANTSYSTASDKTTASNYANYPQYSTTTKTADQSNNGVAYQPYSQQSTAATTSTSYPNFDYGTSRSHNTSNSLPLNHSSSQQVASSYTTTPSSSAVQWGDATTSQTRDPLPYSNSSTANSSSVNLRTSNPQRAQIPPSFNVRPQAPTHAPSRPSSTAATYGQTQHSLPQQSSYTSYSSQPQPQQQTASTQQQQQGWFTGTSATGYGTSAARGGGSGTAGAAGYSTSGTGIRSNRGGSQQQQQHTTSTGAQQQYAQQQHQHQHHQQGAGGHAPAQSHHAMNLSGHAYNSLGSGGDAAGMYNLLPGGAGY